MESNASPVILPQLHHVGVVVRDMDRTMQSLSSVFGIGPWDTRERHYPREQVRVGNGPFRFKVAFAKLGPIELELIEVVAGGTVHSQFLQEKGEGIHHIGFRVPNMDEMAANCQQQGIDILQSARREDGGHIYMDSAQTGGIIFEFAQRPATQ